LAKQLGFDFDNDGFAQGFWDGMSDQEFDDMLNNNKKLSNSDKKWLKDWRNWNNANGKGPKEKELERLQRERQNILRTLKDDVKAIKDNLDDALKVK